MLELSSVDTHDAALEIGPPEGLFQSFLKENLWYLAYTARREEAMAAIVAASANPDKVEQGVQGDESAGKRSGDTGDTRGGASSNGSAGAVVVDASSSSYKSRGKALAAPRAGSGTSGDVSSVDRSRAKEPSSSSRAGGGLLKSKMTKQNTKSPRRKSSKVLPER